MSTGSFPGDWSHYLSCLPPESYNYTQLLDQCGQLDSNSKRIFSGHDAVEVWRTDGTGKLSMSKFDARNIDISGDAAYIIHQNHSWSPLNTSLDAIQQLMIAYKISPIFLDAIMAFGSKVTGEDDPYFNLCSSQTHSSEENGDYELCYLLRTYEKHGRKWLNDPWSLRQMAVYERFDASEGRSVWILIQPFSRGKSEFLRQCFRSQASRITDAKLHGAFIGTALANWRWYLDDQRRLLNVQNEKAVFSKVTPKVVDYGTGFSDCQKLHKLAWALALGEEILASYTHIVRMLQSDLMIKDDGMLDAIRQIHILARTAAALRNNSELITPVGI
ncbi:hypothetical protein EKO27_g10569 [Xylaria grammica]|uniref:CorA-like transporter domain-containing protein n=1 Tax=Xylaria grammica TaxID=363999 RepID=A0A439CQT6_9PEZI|nr:hypothetical protein EKO27_g10569 [Xylaria grammica]